MTDTIESLRARAEKAERARDEAQAEGGKYAAEVGRAIALGSLDGLLCQIGVERHERERAEAALAAAQKRIETLEGALRAVSLHLMVRMQGRLPEADANVRAIVEEALASPSESAPPKDQRAGAAPPAAPDSPFGDDERAAYEAQIETVQEHALAEENENLLLRAGLRACQPLFARIRGDWTDPRSECRAGMAIIDAALSGEANLLRTLIENEEQLAKERE